MKLQSDDISQWCDNLDCFLPEYKTVGCWSPIQFYMLKGRKTVISLDNLEPIPDLHYALYSPQEQRYYLKKFNNVPLGSVLFMKTDEEWDSWDVELNNFRQRIEASLITLLFTQEQVDSTTDILKRLWKANLEGEGKLDYRTYIRIVSTALNLEDYKTYGRELTGFKTICNQLQTEINELWKSAYGKNKG